MCVATVVKARRSHVKRVDSELIVYSPLQVLDVGSARLENFAISFLVYVVLFFRELFFMIIN